MIKKVAISVIIIIFFFSLFYFIFGYNFLSGGDIFFPLNPIESFRQIFSYYNQFYLGGSGIDINYAFPYLAFFILIKSIGFNFIVAQRLWFFSIFTLGFFIFYYFINEFSGDEDNYFHKLIASFLYTINPFTLMMFSTSNLLIVYFSLPLFFIQMYKYYKDLKLKNLLILDIMSIFLIYVGTNPPNYAAFIIFTILIFIIIIIKKYNRIIRIVRDIFIFYLIFILINIFWILSYIVSINKNSIESIAKGEDWFWTSNLSSILNIFRFQGLWAFESEAFSSKYFVYQNYYELNIVIIMGFIILFISLFSLLKKENRSKVILFLFFLLFGIFFAKGVHSPLAGINSWLVLNFPFFWLFREPWPKFMPIVIFSSSCLFYFGIIQISKNIKRKSIESIFLFFLLLILIVNALPFFRMEENIGDRGDLPGASIEIPQYWFESGSYINEIPDIGKILLLPQPPFYQMHYNWWGDGYYGTDPTSFFIFRPLISTAPGGGYVKSQYGNKIIEMFYENYLNNKDFNSKNYLSLMNTMYILHRKDLDWTHMGTGGTLEEPKKVKGLIKDNNIASLNKTFGYFDLDKIKTDQYFLNELIVKYPYLKDESALDFYKIDFSYFNPIFYIPTYVYKSSESIDALPLMVSSKDYNIDSVIYLTSQSENVSKTIDLPKIISKQATIEFKKINPTKYRIIIHNATGIFPINFLESFNSGWKIYLVRNGNINSLVTEDNQFLSNYKIMDSDVGVQADKNELKEFIISGLISTLGDNEEKVIEHRKWEDDKQLLDYKECYNIDFISKNFNGTIQNNNLPNGYVWETWFRKPIISELNHLISNGYANSWIINIDEICSKYNIEANRNGVFDIELIVEFWPQRFLYISLFISALTFLGCIIYLIYDWKKYTKSL